MFVQLNAMYTLLTEIRIHIGKTVQGYTQAPLHELYLLFHGFEFLFALYQPFIFQSCRFRYVDFFIIILLHKIYSYLIIYGLYCIR